MKESHASERVLTRGPKGRILTNIGVWSPDSQWIVYDTRSDPAGEKFDGRTIEVVNAETGATKVVYESRNGAYCGVATFNPTEPKVAFILGPENPAPDWQYNAYHRQGVVVALDAPGKALALDARDLTPPFTPGALRGGSHVHVWDPMGEWVSFTYEDHVLAQNQHETATRQVNLRNVGVTVGSTPVAVKKDHPRNHDGSGFSVLVTRTVANPRVGSDEIQKAFEEGWMGTHGYVRSDGSRQRRALAFQGIVLDTNGPHSEVFIVDLPENLSREGAGPLGGTADLRPFPPAGVNQRRLTFTGSRKFPGIQGPRHWLRSSPDGTQIAFFMKDEQGMVQLWTVSPNGGAPRQLTSNPVSAASSFTWSPDGRLIACVWDGSVCVTDTVSGETTRLTSAMRGERAPRPEACVFSPDGKHIAFVRRLPHDGQTHNQICVVDVRR